MASDPVVDWKPHLGRKVSIRYRLHDSAHPFSEAIGVISSVASDDESGQTLTILSKRGESRSIPASDILASKLFPV